MRQLLSAAGIDRRYFLKGLTGTAATGVAGCCCRAFPTPQIQSGLPSPGGLRPLLKPLKVSATGKPTPYIIDAHAHFFNGSDINARGYFEGGVVRSFPADPQDFARLMGPLLDNLTEYAPTALEEYQYLQEVLQNPPPPKPDEHPLQSKIDEHRGKIAAYIAQAMQDRGLDAVFNKLREDQARKFRVALPKDRSFVDTVSTAIDPRKRQARRRQIYGDKPSGANANDPGGYLEFIGHMLSYRFMNIRDYQEFYTEADGVPGIDAVFNALVDFDYWLDCPTESSREDQVKVQSFLSLLSGGYMLPLVSYNPWTDIKRKDASLNLVKMAIKHYGFVGVKIYPATGFFPYGNALPDQQIVTSQRRPEDLALLDQKLLTMFRWCAANGVPVMAHADETAGVDNGADEFGGPKGWRALLEKMQGGPPPVINIAHFGDDVPPSYHPKNRWPMKFAELLSMPAAKRVYADLGYWTALCSCDTTSGDEATAIGRLTEALATYGTLGNRIMYGSDWFMISTIQAWEKYSADLIHNLQSLRGQLPYDRLFYRNVIDCYGLEPGGAQRDRLLKFFDQVAGGPPRWLSGMAIS